MNFNPKKALKGLVFATTLHFSFIPIGLLNGMHGMKPLYAEVLLLSDVMAAAPSGAGTQYTCPMHPHYISNEAGSCPICGMDLVAMKNIDIGSEIEKNGPQRTPVTVPAEMIQSMGVRTGIAELTQLSRSIRVYGTVSENTRLKASISSRVKGWVIELKKNAIGDQVNAGDLLYTLYSPDLISAQRDFLNSQKGGSVSRTKAAKRRLKLMGVADDIINKIQTDNIVIENMPFFATASGTIVDLGIDEGKYITPETLVASLQSYETVWVKASVAEKDIGRLRKGHSVSLTAPSLRGWSGKGKIDYIYPTVDRNTRTGLVRIAINNDNNLLKPGAYVNVSIDFDKSSVLAVPSQAILRSSKGAHVIAVLGQGRFVPINVETGIVSRDYTQIQSGIEEGQEVVISGQFLIDSESALRESFSKLSKSRMPLSQLALPESDLQIIDHFVDSGLYIHEAIVDGYDVTAESLQVSIQAAIYISKKYEGTKLQSLAKKVKYDLEEVVASRNSTELFVSLNSLIRTLQNWILVERANRYQRKDLFLFEDKHSQFIWAQIGKETNNPYGGGEATIIPYKKVIEGKKQNTVSLKKRTLSNGSN
jgi:Cu(I)/Ag(I) efflux system membrane fusion protein